MNNKKKYFGLKQFWLNWNLKQIWLILVYTVGVVFSLVFLNFSFRFLTENFNVKVDMSNGKIYSLSPVAREYLKNCNRKLKFIIREPYYAYNNSGSANLSDFLEEIASEVVACNNNFEIQYCKSLTDKEYSEKFGNVNFLDGRQYSAQLEKQGYVNTGSAAGDLIIIDETDKNSLKGIHLNLLSCVSEYETYDEFLKMNISKKSQSKNSGDDSVSNKKYTSIAVDAQRRFISAINKLTGVNLLNVGVTTGHNEFDFSLKSDFFDCLGVNFNQVSLKDNIPANLDFLFIAAPMVDFTKEEIAKLETYLNSGGHLLYCASAMQAEGLSVLDEFLKKLGFVFSNGCVVDLDNFNSELGGLSRVDLKNQNNVITEKMVERRDPLVLPLCKPLTLQNSQDGWKVSEICKTLGNYGKVDKNADSVANVQREECVVTAMAQKGVDNGKSAKVVVMSSAFFPIGFGYNYRDRFSHGYKNYSNIHNDSNDVLDHIILSNDSFMHSVFKELAGKEIVPYLPLKMSVFSNGLNFVFKHSRLCHILEGTVIPLLMLMCAVFVWIFRKFLKKK